MDWTQTLTIILSVVGINIIFFVYLLNRMDGGLRDIQKQITDLKSEILWIKFRLEPQEVHEKKTKKVKEN